MSVSCDTWLQPVVSSMTIRAARIEDYLRKHLVTDPGIDLAFEVQDLLMIADDRDFMSIKDFAGHIKRNRTSILNWISRGQNEIPPALYLTCAGQIWDREQIVQWAVDHPLLLGE